MLELHSIDIIGIEITINDKTLDLWSIYIPPSSIPSPETFNNIFSLMNQSSLIGGDFNGHHPVWGSSISDFRGNLIHSAILDYGLCVLNNGEATRINRPPYPDTMVDISISSPNISLSCSWSVLPDPFGSDHLPILISIPNRPSYSNSSHNNYNTSTRFNFYATDWNQFTYQVASLLEPFTLDSSPLNNYNNFVNACADATKVLNKTKRASWEKLCSNLDPATPLSEFWATAKKFKHCIYSPSTASNEDWFENFCNKISPAYVPSEAEISPDILFNENQLSNNVLSHFSSPFNRQELSLAIYSRKSPAGD
ncbi:hypothetical protein QTP88_025988 [Uroleucon formosanum]